MLVILKHDLKLNLVKLLYLCLSVISFNREQKFSKKRGIRKRDCGSGGIRTHAPEETGALNQRLRPLGHATSYVRGGKLYVFKDSLW